MRFPLSTGDLLRCFTVVIYHNFNSCIISLIIIVRLLLKSVKASVFGWHEKCPTVNVPTGVPGTVPTGVVKSYILKGIKVSGVYVSFFSFCSGSLAGGRSSSSH